MPDFFIGGDQFDSIVSATDGLYKRTKGALSAITGTTQEIEITENGIETVSFVPKSLTYPHDLKSSNNHSNFMMFRAIELDSTTKAYYGNMRTNFTSQSTTKAASEGGKLDSNILTTIALYAPNMVEEITHEFDKYGTTPLAEFASAAFGAAGQVAQGNVGEGVAGGKAAGLEFAGATVANTERGLMSKARAQALSSGSIVLKDNVSVNAFKSTALRSQTFLYTFMPKSLDELKEVGNIIKAFWGYSLATPTSATKIPSFGEENFDRGVAKYSGAYKTPPVWMIEEVSDMTNVQRYTPRFIFGPAGITSVKLNRTPDQYWRTFVGTAGDSSAIEMEVTFTELIPMNRNIYERDSSSSIYGYGG